MASTILPEHSSLALLALSIASIAYLWAPISKYLYGYKLPYPPGPPQKSILTGNWRDIMIPSVWLKYMEWANEYGSLLYIRVFGQRNFILNTMEDAVELLERRSRIYSSRPVVPMNDLMGFSTGTAVRPYSPEWRSHRRTFQQMFKPESSLAYRPIQTKKAYDMLHGLLTTPEEFRDHIHRFAGAIVLSIVYGYTVQDKNDHFVFLFEATGRDFSLGSSHKWLVNHFPFLGYVPSWFPGAEFKRRANSVNNKTVEAQEAPFSYAVKEMSLGNDKTSMVSRLYNTCRSDAELQLLKEVSGSSYAAGIGTTVSSILVFITAMVLYPDIQKKAQAEIYRVTGGERLPDYDDQASLPYIEALVREVFRWKPLFPLGIAHMTSEDDVYKGYFIPKNSNIHPNVWAITRDPEVYEDPENFNPDRFFTDSGELNDDDVTYVFGFGRRICPGRHLGIASVWLAVATILASFNLENEKDSSGHDIPLDVQYRVDGIISAPMPFTCSITPRSDKAKRLIQDSCEKL